MRNQPQCPNRGCPGGLCVGELTAISQPRSVDYCSRALRPFPTNGTTIAPYPRLARGPEKNRYLGTVRKTQFSSRHPHPQDPTSRTTLSGPSPLPYYLVANMGKSHLHTPQKTRINFYYNELVSQQGKASVTAVAKHFKLSRPTIYRVLQSGDRSFHSTYNETKGRPRKLSDTQCNQIAALLDFGDYDIQHLTWRGLVEEIGIDAYEDTIRYWMQ